MGKVAVAIAEKDVNKWLDYKQIDDEEREENSDQIDNLIRYVSSGKLILGEDCVFIQKLNFPIKGEIVTSELKYMARSDVSTINSNLRGVKADNPDGRVVAYIAALTQNPKGLIEALDTSDYKVGQSIAVFFI